MEKRRIYCHFESRCLLFRYVALSFASQLDLFLNAYITFFWNTVLRKDPWLQNLPYFLEFFSLTSSNTNITSSNMDVRVIIVWPAVEIIQTLRKRLELRY